MSVSAELTHLFRAMKAPAAARALPKLVERAREEEWSHERFLEALLATEQASRDTHGGEARIKHARFPARKTLEEFDFSFQRSIKKTLVLHLGQLDFLHGRETSSCSAHPAPAKPTSRSPWGSAPASPASASCSPPRPSGSPGSQTPNGKDAWPKS
jgi:hypothetical protein